LDVVGFTLKDSEIAEISELDKNLKFNAPTNVSLLNSFKASGEQSLTIHSMASLATSSLKRAFAFALCLARFYSGLEILH
jgi:hypothetical protein